MSQPQEKKSSFGVALVVALILVPMVLLLAFGLSRLGTQNLRHADNALQSKKALLAAETGAMEAIRQLHSDSTWSSGWAQPQTLPNGSETYTVEITNNFAGSAQSTASNGAVVPAGTAYVLATGSARGGEITRRVGVLLKGGSADASFRYGLFCYTWMDVGNGTVDSFDSKVALYPATPPQDLQNAPIGTNSVTSPAAGGVHLGPGAKVGAVDIGVNGSAAVAVSCKGGTADHTNCPCHGAVTALEKPYPLDLSLVAPPAGTSLGDQDFKKDSSLAPGHYDDVKVSGSASVELSAGTYVVKTLDVSGSAQIVVKSGPILFYVTGDPRAKVDLNLSGNSVANTTGLASNLQFRVGPAVEEVVINGGPDVTCAILAPRSHVTINGTAGSFTGGLVANTATLTGNAQFHYDRALSGGSNSNGNPLRIISWQRI